MLQLLLNYDESVRPPDGFTKSDSLHKRSFVFFYSVFCTCRQMFEQFSVPQSAAYFLEIFLGKLPKSFNHNSDHHIRQRRKIFFHVFFFMINIFVSQFNYGDSPSTASLQPPDGHSLSCLCILLPSSQTLLSFFKVVLINSSLIVFTVLCCTLDVFSFTFTSVLVTDRYWRNVFFICLLKT